MVETNLVVIEGDWNNGDFLREIRFMDDEKLEKFISKFKEVGRLYRRYKQQYNFRNYGDFMNWLDEYNGDDIADPMDYFMFIEEYFPYEGHSQTGCKYVILNYGKVIVDYDDFKIERI